VPPRIFVVCCVHGIAMSVIRATKMLFISKWWSEGEEGSKLVYRQSFVGFLTAAVASLAVAALLSWLRTWYGFGIGFIVTGRALAERRRAIILTHSSIVYRPAFGKTIEVAHTDVESIESCSAPVSFWFRAQLFKGLRFRLKNGRNVVIPVDFPHSEGIVQEILKDCA
jgi:hypothetical protein